MSVKQISWVSTSKEKQWETKKVQINASTPEVTGAACQPSDLRYTSRKRQLIEGFGGCFNELGMTALLHLNDEERNKVYDDLFALEGDCRFQICRLPIGASDYALEWYSHNEHDGDYEMAHFNIERDKRFLIPYIREALRRNPELKLFASPWSPPTWMKHPRVYNYGTLRWEKEVLEAYALYLVKFIEAYRDEGIVIHQLHVQNEVAADQKFPSCIWSGEQLRDFIRDHLGPAFEKHGLDTEIWLGTINGKVSQLFTKSAFDYNAIAHTVLSDPGAYSYIRGVGFQWAGKYSLPRTVASYPELRYLQTENECGDGNNTWDYAKYVFDLYHHYLVNGVNGYIYWNMALEPRGLSTWGWEQNAMITVDPESGKAVYNPEYYVMKHFSHFIQANAVRIELEGHWNGNAVAFENPDESAVIVVANPFETTRSLTIEYNGQLLSCELLPESFNTMIIK